MAIIIKPYPDLHPDGWQNENPETPLQEMAFPKKTVELHLLRYSGALFTHLLKIFYFRDTSRDLRGWMSTVHKCAFQTFKIKALKEKKDHRLSAEEIYELLWGGRVDVFQSHHEGMLKDFNTKSNPEYTYLPYVHQGGDAAQAELFMKGYYVWLAKNLSVKEKITFEEVKDEITALLKKYPVN